jgi:hypothetical protein
MKFPEMYKVVPIANDLALTANPTVPDSINMSNYHRATFIIQTHTLGGGDPVLTVLSGASAAAKTSTLYFKYAFAGSTILGATADVLAADSAPVNTLTIAHATYDNWMLIVEVDAADMDMANQEEWLTLNFADAGATTGNVTIVAILEPRFTGARSATALA